MLWESNLEKNCNSFKNPDNYKKGHHDLLIIVKDTTGDCTWLRTWNLISQTPSWQLWCFLLRRTKPSWSGFTDSCFSSQLMPLLQCLLFWQWKKKPQHQLDTVSQLMLKSWYSNKTTKCPVPVHVRWDKKGAR